MTFPLNLPVDYLLADAESVLLAGAGGGFDVLTALPLYHHLRGQGKRVHLASYSFMDLGVAEKISRCEVLLPGLLAGTYGNLARPTPYYPEGYLAQWFEREQGEDIPVWMVKKTGVPAVTRAYRTLIEHLKIDAIVLCDGGIDSLMRGNEQGAGTLLEDTISVTAVAALDDVTTKILVTVGIGTEVEENINHHAFLENVAALAKKNAYYGACALLPQMPAFQFYEAAARFIFEMPGHESSRIQTRLIPAVWGEFGDYNWYNHPRQPEVFLSPLTSLYWFFDTKAVSRLSLLAGVIRNAETFSDATAAFRGWLAEHYPPGSVKIRRRERLPLT